VVFLEHVGHVDNNPAGVITAPLVVLENHSLKNLILG
jgi:hypothetical protein